LEESEEVDCLVLELVEGESLRGPLPIPVALDRGRQVAEALEAAHARGIIHRDLKPSNIKVTPEGRVKVLDFGLAKAIAATERNLDSPQAATVTGAQTVMGRVVGTPGYMSPEQARGLEVDECTDIWAFGCVFYELLAGIRVFRGDTNQETLAAVLEREPDWQALPAKTPARIRALLRDCLQKDATRRPSTIAEVRKRIEQEQSGRNRGGWQRSLRWCWPLRQSQRLASCYSDLKHLVDRRARSTRSSPTLQTRSCLPRYPPTGGC
jgi:serine/threonine protein kinase